MPRFLVLFLFLQSLMGSWIAPASAQVNPFRVEIAPITVQAGAKANLSVLVVVPAGHHTYRDMMEVKVDEPGPFKIGKARFPKGEIVPDPAFPDQTRESYDSTPEVLVPITVPATVKPGSYSISVYVRYQGCKATICFMPQEGSYDVDVNVTPGATPPAEAPKAVVLPPAVDEPVVAIPPPAATPGPSMDVFGARPSLTEQSPVAARAVAGQPGEILVGFFLAQDWHVNRAMTSVKITGVGIAETGQTWPEARHLTDPATQEPREEIGGDFLVRIALSGPDGSWPVTLDVAWQACKDKLCQMPQKVQLPVTLVLGRGAGLVPAAPPAAAASTVPAAPTEPNTFENMRQKGLVWLVLFVFGAGFLVSLTPCVLPMIPITMGIIGARASGGRLKAATLSLAYVAGLALVYTILGVIAGLTGSLFGGWMQSPWIVGGVAIFFAAMGLAMFGLFDVALPSSLSTRLSQMGGAGYAGAFVVGMVGALVAGPCSGPVIASLMVLVGQQGEIVLGVVLMLSFSLGMGVLFVLAGIFSSTLIRPGAWMDTVKHAFGVIMLLGAIYFGRSHLPDWLVPLLVSGVLLVTGVFGWPANEDDGFTIARTRKLYSLVAGLVGGWFLIGSFIHNGWVVGPLVANQGSVVAVEKQGIHWTHDEAAALARARADNMPVIIDFGAEWCVACKELEAITYKDPIVVEAASRFVTVMVDCTNDKDPQVQELTKRYGVQGLPTVQFLRPDGSPIEALKVIGFVDAGDFRARMDKALGPEGR